MVPSISPIVLYWIFTPTTYSARFIALLRCTIDGILVCLFGDTQCQSWPNHMHAWCSTPRSLTIDRKQSTSRVLGLHAPRRQKYNTYAKTRKRTKNRSNFMLLVTSNTFPLWAMWVYAGVWPLSLLGFVYWAGSRCDSLVPVALR